jgi:hypothetical protein
MHRYLLFSGPPVLCLLLAWPVQAQLPSIRLDSIFPAGGRAGAAVEVQVAGADFEDVKGLRFSHPGLRAEPLGPGKFKVAIAADTPPGLHDVRAIGRHGISNPLAFAVSTGLEEILQKRPNHSAEEAQPVPFGCAVNGRFSGSLEDFYRVPLKKGQRVIVECLAERLDSELDATLSVLAPDGREVGSCKDHFGRDPLVDFTADSDGEHLVRLYDFHFRGGSVYRLLIGARPVLDAVLPSVLGPGQTHEVTLIGRNLPGGQPLPMVGADGKRREHLKVKLSAPRESEWLWSMRSPSLDLRQFQFTLSNEHGQAQPITLRLEPGPHLLEVKPNATSETAQELPAEEAVVTGQLLRYRDSSWYRIRLRAKQTYFLSLAAERIDSPGDFYVQVFDPKGKFVTELDNHGTNIGGAYRGFMRDPYGSITAQEDGDYRLMVADRMRVGSPRHRYTLTISKPRPDFTVLVCHNLTENLKAPRQLLAGASQALDLVVLRRDNFTGELTCAVEGLPSFIRCPPIRIAGPQDRGILVFTAEKDAPPWEGSIRVRCKARIGDQEVERFAVASVMTNNLTDPLQMLPSRLAREICLGLRPGAPFALIAAPEKEMVQRGQKLRLKVQLQRYLPEFTGKVTLTGLQLPTGFTPIKGEIAAGQNETTLELDANAGPDTYSFAVRGEAQVPLARDPKTPKKDTTVVLPSNLVTVTVAGK